MYDNREWRERSEGIGSGQVQRRAFQTVQGTVVRGHRNTKKRHQQELNYTKRKINRLYTLKAYIIKLSEINNKA